VYFKEFNELFEELQGKKVGIFGVCAQPQRFVDQTMKDWGLKFTVRILGRWE
jgi:peroxiredoxin